MASEGPVTMNGSFGASSHAAPLTNGAGSDPSSTSSQPAGPPKDEIGWYFVEKYYTTMSRNPEKVHLFYNKRSQFVYGVEAEKVPVSVGQRAINERIAELGIDDCKVRVTNVDCLETGQSIILQVIGEKSIKSQPHRKFAQTFVLAEQPNGYFVLNDIFRYIADEPEDEELEPEIEPQPETIAESQTDIKALSGNDDLVEQDKSMDVVDKKLEHVAGNEVPTVEATSIEEPVITEAGPVDETAPAVEISPSEANKSVGAEVLKPEAPKDPEPSPSPSPAPAAAQQQAPREPAPTSKPAAPKTWASMLAGTKPPVPAVPNVPIQSSSQAQPPSKASSAAALASAPAQISPPPAQAAAATNKDNEVPASPGGWQTAGQDHGKKSSRSQQGAGGAGNVSGYIKNVTPTIEDAALRQHLSQYGRLTHFDVSRPKNAAFVEFESPAGYNAAVAANPHKVNGEEVNVEERRPRAGTYGSGGLRGGPRGGGRGGMEGGRTPSQGGRGGLKEGRGGFATRARGGGSRNVRGGSGQET